MNKTNIVLLMVTSLFIVGCKTPTLANDNSSINNYSYSTEALMQNLKTLSSDAFEGRRTGTNGAFKAKTFIIEALIKHDVKPLVPNYEQHFEFNARGKDFKATNVLGLIKGTDNTSKHIVLSAHYDHEGVKNGKIYNGADDDASGISALLAFAEYFKTHPPKHNVIIAAFDAEELGLIGSYHFIKDNVIKQKNIVLNLNMDMISRSDKNELFAVGTRYYPQLKPIIDNIKNTGIVNLLIGHDGLHKGDNWTYSSDHAAFHKANIPFIYFGVSDHKDYHKPTDDFERIHPQFYKDAVEIIIQSFVQFDALDL